ncbi:MAG: hypothetical protein HQ567_09335 [Candidatus Nealsonbacteria bacterium]|nr:hypothetical protein [Candidatus Nealsonbacteria bacterium]
MDNPTSRGAHTFHIPVMGIGFTIDTPLRIAKYGISSVISLVDDTLIEQMRSHYCRQEGEPYEEITSRDEDARARRITAYLNLLDRLVSRQVEVLQASPFQSGSEITRYYEMLPDSPLKQTYHAMLASDDPQRKADLQDQLRRLAVPGNIDVNIMSRGDADAYRDGKKRPQEFSEAMAALRGYANSSLRSSIVFSAGMNPRLYGYAAKFGDFFPDHDSPGPHGMLKKEIVLKVSDYRSAVIQGKFFAKRGLWVSEYRVESGLNCGGHAYATKGLLLGPILDEFKQKKDQLIGQLHAVYMKALAASGRMPIELPHDVRVTAQGGIGTAEEDALLLNHYNVDATGWATPFLLVPEVANVDPEHLEKLQAATPQDVFLSDNSPFGVPFWNLRNSASEEARRQRIDRGKPGSVCHKTHVRFNTEFTEIPICAASRNYQRRKLKRLAEDDLTPDQLALMREHVTAKSCICHDLGGSVTLRYGLDPDATPAMCPGPSIADFSKIATLEEMVSHIYARAPLPMSADRPHMFIREIGLYADYLRDEIEWCASGLLSRPENHFDEFKENLLSGIEYYRGLVERLDEQQRQRFLDELGVLHEAIESILLVAVE